LRVCISNELNIVTTLGVSAQNAVYHGFWALVSIIIICIFILCVCS